MNNGNDGIHQKAEGFGEDDPVEDAEALEAHEKVKALMREHLGVAMKEVEDGTLHGLVIVRVNEDGQTASCTALYDSHVRQVGLKLQEMSMDLVLPPDARRELKQLMGMLRSLG
jgi:hypothetical protein